MSRIVIERRPDEERLTDLGVRTWLTWSAGEPECPWHYDEQEACYFLEGPWWSQRERMSRLRWAPAIS